jgi:hypothetical protein
MPARSFLASRPRSQELNVAVAIKVRAMGEAKFYPRHGAFPPVQPVPHEDDLAPPLLQDSRSESTYAARLWGFAYSGGEAGMPISEEQRSARAPSSFPEVPRSRTGCGR